MTAQGCDLKGLKRHLWFHLDIKKIGNLQAICKLRKKTSGGYKIRKYIIYFFFVPLQSIQTMWIHVFLPHVLEWAIRSRLSRVDTDRGYITAITLSKTTPSFSFQHLRYEWKRNSPWFEVTSIDDTILGLTVSCLHPPDIVCPHLIGVKRSGVLNISVTKFLSHSVTSSRR